MNINPQDNRMNTLLAKGGIMFFTIERPAIFYKGMVLLSPLKDNRQRRAVYIKEYKRDCQISEQGGL